jgi:hypothetical protein
MATRADACESHRECTCRVYTAHGARRFVLLADEAVLVMTQDRKIYELKIRPLPEGPTKKVMIGLDWIGLGVTSVERRAEPEPVT